jgi:myosin-crossreactive antigen
MLHRDFDAASGYLIDSGLDNISTREWLRRDQHMDFEEIQKLETLDTYVFFFISFTLYYLLLAYIQ